MPAGDRLGRERMVHFLVKCREVTAPVEAGEHHGGDRIVDLHLPVAQGGDAGPAPDLDARDRTRHRPAACRRHHRWLPSVDVDESQGVAGGEERGELALPEALRAGGVLAHLAKQRLDLDARGPVFGQDPEHCIPGRAVAVPAGAVRRPGRRHDALRCRGRGHVAADGIDGSRHGSER